jgi:hypothetical protein
MHPLAQQLADVFMRDFGSADREIEWVVAEEERSLWLSPTTVLLGRVDARGRTDGQPFFGEWKSLSNYRGRYIEEEKIKWRTDPQALTYGVLVPETSRFTVRWAIKPDTKGRGIATAFEWYTYTPVEIEHWRSQLLQIADEIRLWRKGPIPWRTNFGNCFRYGIKYQCPFFDKCSRQAWSESMGAPRIPHLKIERDNIQMCGNMVGPNVVVLDASRVGDYLECPESYRRKWEGEGFQEENENLTIGTDFHKLISQHITSLVKENANAHA